MCWTEEGADTEACLCAIFSTVTPDFGACCVKEGFWLWCDTETVLREALERQITFGLTGNLSIRAANHKLMAAAILFSPQVVLPKIWLVLFPFLSYPNAVFVPYTAWYQSIGSGILTSRLHLGNVQHWISAKCLKLLRVKASHVG